jgi:hypothetical protein
MLRNETVGNAADLFHFCSYNATLLENLQISLGSAWQFRLEQDHYHRREENGMDSNQGRHPGINLYHHLFFCYFNFSTANISLNDLQKNSAREKNIDVTDVIYLDDYAPAQVTAIKEIARNSYQQTRSKFDC